MIEGCWGRALYIPFPSSPLIVILFSDWNEDDVFISFERSIEYDSQHAAG